LNATATAFSNEKSRALSLRERDARANTPKYKGKKQVFRGKLHWNNVVSPLKRAREKNQAAGSALQDLDDSALAKQHIV
jgi:hypothetical protein